MVKIKQSVFDSGPIIHLSEINSNKCYSLFSKIFITPEVQDEINFKDAPGKRELKKIKNIFIKHLDFKHKDITKFLAGKYDLDLGESSAIALCRQESIRFFFTDDLDARITGKIYKLKVHGTVGILLRAFRKGILSRKEVMDYLNALKSSSLFITSDIVNGVIAEVNSFRR